MFQKKLIKIALSLSAFGAMGVAWAQEKPQETATPAPTTEAQALGGLSGNLNPNTVDAILVTVADEIILLSELQKVIQVASDRQSKLEPTGKLVGGAMAPTDAQMLLEQLVDQKVLSLKIKEMTLNVGDEELEGELQAFLKQQNITQEQFQQLLKQEGETPETHREEFRNQLETQRFIGRVIRPLVSVTDDEVRSFYLQSSNSADKIQKIKLRSLVINFPSDLSEDQKQAKQKTVNNIKQQVDSGANFVNLVKLFSESPDAIKTEGLLPARPMRELPSELKDLMKDAKQGTVLGPVAIGPSVFFFQYVGAEMDDSGNQFEKEKKQWENRLLDIKFKERLGEYIKAERAKVKIVKRDFKIAR